MFIIVYNINVTVLFEKYLRSNRTIKKNYPNIRNKAKRMTACLVNVILKDYLILEGLFCF